MFHTATNADTRHLYTVGASLWRLACAIFTKEKRPMGKKRQ